MNQLRFHIYTSLAPGPGCYALAYVGMKLGAQLQHQPSLQETFHRFHLGVELVPGHRLPLVRHLPLEESHPHRGRIRRMTLEKGHGAHSGTQIVLANLITAMPVFLQAANWPTLLHLHRERSS